MDLIQKTEKTRIYGREFLTWLLFRTSVGDGVVKADGQEFEVFFVDKGRLVDVMESQQATLKQDSPFLSNEAVAGLAHGKLVDEAVLNFNAKDKSWTFTFNANRWTFSGVKLPALLTEESDDRILERFELLKELQESMEYLFAFFLKLRLDKEAWEEQSTAFEKWARLDLE